MDTGKLLRVLDDIQKDEAQHGLQSIFQSIAEQYASNNGTSIDKELGKLRSNLIDGELNDYVLTDYEILQSLKIEDYFGMKSYAYLDSILNLPPHQVNDTLQKYVAERQAAVSKVGALKSAMNALNLSPRELGDGQYEIGFSLPIKYSDLAKLEGALSDIHQFLNGLADAIDDPQHLKIDYVSNGSIQFFIQSSLDLALSVDHVLSYALAIYEIFQGCKKLKSEVSKFSSKRRKEVEKEIEAQCKEDVNKQIEELMKALEIKDQVKSNDVKLRFNELLKHLEEGVAAEVRVPIVPEPAELTEGASIEERKAHKEELKKYELNEKIKSDSKEIFILQQNNFFGNSIKFLGEDESSDT